MPRTKSVKMSDTVKASFKKLTLKGHQFKNFILPSTSENKGLVLFFLFDRFSIHGVSISVQNCPMQHFKHCGKFTGTKRTIGLCRLL